MKVTLTCWKCKTNSIPAPAGATEKTKYICRECSGLGTASGAGALQRWKYDPRFERSGANKAEHELVKHLDLKQGAVAIRGNNPDDMRDPENVTPEDARREFRRIKRLVVKRGQRLPVPASLNDAALAGEAWALALLRNTDAVFSLPAAQGLAILYSVWGGLNGLEIARVLGCSTRQASTMAIRRAKAKLAKSVTKNAVTNIPVEGNRPADMAA